MCVCEYVCVPRVCEYVCVPPCESIYDGSGGCDAPCVSVASATRFSCVIVCECVSIRPWQYVVGK